MKDQEFNKINVLNFSLPVIPCIYKSLVLLISLPLDHTVIHMFTFDIHTTQALATTSFIREVEEHSKHVTC